MSSAYTKIGSLKSSSSSAISSSSLNWDQKKTTSNLRSQSELIVIFPVLNPLDLTELSVNKLLSSSSMQRDFLGQFNNKMRDKTEIPSEADFKCFVSQYIENKAVSEIQSLTNTLSLLGDSYQSLLEQINIITSSSCNSNTILFRIQLVFNSALKEASPTKILLSHNISERSLSSWMNKILSKKNVVSEKQKILLNHRKTLESLEKNLLIFRNNQQTIMQWSNERIPNRIPFHHFWQPPEALPLVFKGIWQGLPAPIEIKSSLWPPLEWRCFAWEELCRSYLGGETNVFQRESMKLEGEVPIEVTNLFVKGADGTINITPKIFFVKVISTLNNWMNPSHPMDEKVARVIVRTMLEVQNKPITLFQYGKAKRLLKDQDQNVEANEKEIKDLVYLMRAKSLSRRYPVMSLLSAATINAARGVLSVRRKYLPELFARSGEANHKEFYCSQADHQYGTHLTFQCLDDLRDQYRVTQTTQYHIHAHPHRVSDNTLGESIATFKLHWTVGIDTKNNQEPRRYEFKITDLTFTGAASLEDCQFIPILFKQAQSRYTAERMGGLSESLLGSTTNSTNVCLASSSAD